MGVPTSCFGWRARVGWLWAACFVAAACGAQRFAASTDAGLIDSKASAPEAGSGIVIGPVDATAVSGSCTDDKSVCTGLCGARTGLRGTVFDPSGKNPVPNAVVWVPFRTPDPMPASLSCDCAAVYTGGFVGSFAVTASDGSFVINGAPSAVAGTSVPLVVQLGKWRYQTHVDVVCGQDNVVPDGVLRLPQGGPGTGVQFEGDLPQIAISTGGADTLECLLTRIGVSEQEYVAGAGAPQHVHIFQGSPSAVAPNTPTPAPQSASNLWDSVEHLAQFDLVLLSCEGAPTTNANPQALYTYGTMGGHVFASHQQFQWFLGAPFPAAGTWFTQNSNRLATAFAEIASTLPNGAPFPDGVQMAQWMQTVGALDSNGEFPIVDAYHSIDVPSARTLPAWIPWIYYDASRSTLAPTMPADPLDSASAVFLTYDAPTPAMTESSCGRFVYSELHDANPNDYGPTSTTRPDLMAVPTGCAANDALTSQEKALEFMLFSLPSCSTFPAHGAPPADAAR